MKAIWFRLGRTDAINWVVITVIATLQFVGSFVTRNPNTEGREVLYLGCVAVSVVVIVALLLATRYCIIPFLPPKARPFVVLVMLQVTALSRAFVFDGLMVNFDFAANGMILTRIYGSQSPIFVSGIVVASLVSMARDFSESNERLIVTLEGLRTSQEDIEAKIRQRQSDLVTSIKAQLQTSISSLTGTNTNQDAQSLKSLIDDVVRPISHRLGREFDSASETVTFPASATVRWSSVLRNALLTNPVHPVWLTIWSAFISIQVISLTAGADFVLPYLAAVAEFAIWFTISKYVWQVSSKRFHLILRAFLFSLLMMATSVVLNFLLEVQFRLPFFNARAVIFSAIYFLVMGWTVALVISVSDLLSSTNTELSTATTQLKRQLISDNVNARHFEQAVSHVLHGPIQDAIAASLKRIESRATGSDIGLSEGELIRAHIESALELLNESSVRTYSVEQGVTDLAELWSGVVEIELDCEVQSYELLNSAQTTSSIVLEVIREAVSNSIRHGDAKHIVIAIRVDMNNADVHISVQNDGVPIPDNYNQGIGSGLLDSMTMSWLRENQSDGVQFHAVVPLQKS